MMTSLVGRVYGVRFKQMEEVLGEPIYYFGDKSLVEWRFDTDAGEVFISDWKTDSYALGFEPSSREDAIALLEASRVDEWSVWAESSASAKRFFSARGLRFEADER